jgi:hypothetical protein
MDLIMQNKTLSADIEISAQQACHPAAKKKIRLCKKKKSI